MKQERIFIKFYVFMLAIVFMLNNPAKAHKGFSGLFFFPVYRFHV